MVHRRNQAARLKTKPRFKTIGNPTIVYLVEGAYETGNSIEAALESLRERGAAAMQTVRRGSWKDYGDGLLIARLVYAVPVIDLELDADPRARIDSYTIDGRADILVCVATDRPFKTFDLESLSRFRFPPIRRKQRQTT